MTSAAALRARYARDGASTASPNRLLLMLVDRMCVDAEIAIAALESRDYATSGKRLQNAQAILMQLRSSLDLTKWPAGKKTADLYVWLYGQLVQANVTASADKIREVLPMMRELRDTWHQAAMLVAEQTPRAESA